MTEQDKNKQNAVKNPPRKNLPKLVARINRENTPSKRIKLRYHVRANCHSLYLDYVSKNGRERPSLKLRLLGTSSSWHDDLDTIKLATAIRDEKENELIKNETGFSLVNHDDKIDFIAYFENIGKKKNNFNYDIVAKHLKDFANDKAVPFKRIDKRYFQKFERFLQQKKRRQDDNKISQNTIKSYFRYISAVLNQAVEEDIIKNNPVKTMGIKAPEPIREFLTENELEKVFIQETSYKETKNAFMFSCFTGLRFIDISKLKYSIISDGYIMFRQSKTGQVENIKLAMSALRIIEEQKKRSGKNTGLIFKLLTKQTISNQIRSFCTAAGITKKITFHCGRHTFACLLLAKGVGIFTVSKLLGHNNIKSTLIYAKLVDKVKDDAIDLLPDLV